MHGPNSFDLMGVRFGLVLNFGLVDRSKALRVVDLGFSEVIQSEIRDRLILIFEGLLSLRLHLIGGLHPEPFVDLLAACIRKE